MKKKKYVVTDGLVQEYSGLFDFFKKKYGLEPYINFLLNFWDFLLLQFKSSQFARDLLGLYQKFLAFIESILSYFSKDPIAQLV
jgi:hypothetical protein